MSGATKAAQEQKSNKDHYWTFGRAYQLLGAGVLISLLGIVILAVDLNEKHLGSTIPGWAQDRLPWFGLLVLVGGLFTANFARMLQIWHLLKAAQSTSPENRSPQEKETVRLGFRELFTYLFTSLAVLTGLVFLSPQKSWLPWTDIDLLHAASKDANLTQLIPFLTILFLAFVPLICGFYLQARTQEKGAEKRETFRKDAISVPSFWMSATVTAGIIALASWAANPSGLGSEELAVWITFATTFAVIALFLAFIFLPHLIAFIEEAADGQNRVPGTQDDATTAYAGFPVLTAPAHIASYFDSALVRLVAPLTGATQHGPGVPHSFVLFSILPLSALGFSLAAPFGLIPIGLGMLMVVALGRRWAWVEEDRETASRLLTTESPEINVGFDNDLKDEALLGYASLFLLVPLALNQIYGWQSNAFEAGSGNTGNPFFDWLSFFGAELAKAVPFVDWWEIYRVNLPEAFVTVDDHPLGKHLTFASRAMVDLVIMAALLQAVGIWQRSQTQKRLYAAGQVDSFDPFTENAFFKKGMRLRKGRFVAKDTFEEVVLSHVEKRLELGLPAVPYNERRLSHLLQHEDEEIRAGAKWMIDHFDVLAGTPSQQAQQLLEQWKNGPLAAKAPNADKREMAAYRREQKLRLERLLYTLLDLENEAVP
ncbi:MAG: hypothetical protein R3C04_09315 [Hyphomonas sp.]